jgi:hypothetical protein
MRRKNPVKDDILIETNSSSVENPVRDDMPVEINPSSGKNPVRDDISVEQAESGICPCCNAPLVAGHKFCRICGKQVQSDNMKVIRIGRASSNDIVIDEPLVDMQHCQIIVDDNENMRLIDLDSTNGVYVNGSRISGEVSINRNAIIRIGSSIFFAHPLDGKLEQLGQNSPRPFPPQDAMCYSTSESAEEWKKERERLQRMNRLNPRLKGNIGGNIYKCTVNFPLTELETVISSIKLDSHEKLILPHSGESGKLFTEAKIVYNGEIFEIFDHSYGRIITVNNKRIKDNCFYQFCELKDGDVIKIENAVFTFRYVTAIFKN